MLSPKEPEPATLQRPRAAVLPTSGELQDHPTPGFKPLTQTTLIPPAPLADSATIELQSSPSTLASDNRLKNILKPGAPTKESERHSIDPQKVLERVCTLSNDESHLKEYALNNKPVTNFIFLVGPADVSITLDNFEKLAGSEISVWETLSADIKKHLFDLFDAFREHTKISDAKCLQALASFVKNTDYLDRVMLKDRSPNAEYLRSLYEINTGDTRAFRISNYSDESNRVMTGILSEYCNINRMAMQCIGVVERHIKKGPFGQALSRDKLYEALWMHYFGIINRVNAVRLVEFSPSFIDRYFIDQKVEQLMLARLLVYLAEEFKQQKLVSRSFLSQIIGKMDSYRPLEDVRSEIRNLFNEAAIEEVHQRILVFLLQLDRVRKNPPKGLVWLEGPDLEKEIAQTNSNCLAPFRQILYGVNKLLFNRDPRSNNVIGCKNALRNVRSPDWADWMELFILKYTSDEYVDDLEAIVKAVCRVYTSAASLDKAWKRSDTDEPTNIIKFLRKMKDNEARFRYTLLSVMIGNKRSEHVREVVGSDMFSENDWEPHVYRSMATQIGDFQRSRLSDSHDRQKQLAFLSCEKKDVQAKIIFFARILELQPGEACSIETHMFSRTERNSNDNQLFVALKTFMFLIDCLRFYSREPNLDYCMLKHIFRAINSISSCSNTQLSNALFLAIGLSATFEPGAQQNYYPYLGFIQHLQNSSNNADAQDLIKELKAHLDILLCNIDVMKVLPDLWQSNRDTYEPIRASFNNRYTLSGRQLKELLEKAKLRSYPESAWVRTILEVVKLGPMDFALLARVLKKFLVRPTNTSSECPRLLLLISNALKELKMVETILATVEVTSINSELSYAKVQGNIFGVENHLIVNTWFDSDPAMRLNARERIQDALGLLFVLLNLSQILTRSDRRESSLSSNFVVEQLRSMKFQPTIDRLLLTKSSLYSYRDQADFANTKTINIVETLFAHLNFELLRAQPLEFNTSLRFAEANSMLDPSSWSFGSNDLAEQEARSLQHEYNSSKARLDHTQLANVLEPPANKLSESRESVSMNAVRCVCSLLVLWHEQAANRVSLVDSLLNSSVIPHVMRSIKVELLRTLARYRSSPTECMLILEMLALAAQREFSFVEALLLPDESGSLLAVLEDYLHDNHNDPVFFWKVTALLGELFLNPSKKQKSCEQLFSKTSFCMLLVKKLEEINQRKEPSVSLPKVSLDGKQPLDIFDRILLQRQIFREVCCMLATAKIVEISLELYLLKQSQALPCLRVLIEYAITSQLYVLDAQSKHQQTHPQLETELTSMHSNLVYGMRNYLKDPQEEYYIDEGSAAGKHSTASNRLLIYLECIRDSTAAYCKKVRVMEALAVHDMFLVVLSTGRKGYLMETQQMSIQSEPCQRLLCYNHQPKLQAGFTDLFGKGLDNTVDNIRTLAMGVLAVLSGKSHTVANYDRMTLLLNACLEAIKGTRLNCKSAREVVSEILRNLHWVSDQSHLIEQSVISSFSAAKLAVCLLNLQHQLKVPAEELAPLAKVVERTLVSSNLDPTQRSVVINMLLNFVGQPVRVLQLLISSLADSNPLYFYNTSRVLAEYISRYSVEICQAGLIDSYMRSPILSGSNRMDKLVFYTADGERSPEHMSWLWTLQVMKCLCVYSDDKGYVVNEVIKLVEFFRQRIYTVLSLPALLTSKQQSGFSYAFLDELEAVLSLLQVLYYQADSWLFTHREFFENVLYLLSHKTIELFAPQLPMSRTFLAHSNCERKLQQTRLVAQQAFQPEQVNYIAGMRGTVYSGSYRPNMFLLSVELKYVQCAGSLLSVMANGYPHSLFVEKYFDEPIDRQMNFTYQTLFWTRLNRWLPMLQQYLEYTAQKWAAEGQLEALLTLHRQSQQSVEVFASNGYLASMFPFQNRAELLERLAYIAYWSVELAESYLQLQLRFRNRYFSLLAEDLSNFKNTELQFIQRLADKFEKKTSGKFVEAGLRLDKVRV